VHRIDSGIDTGEVLVQKRYPLDPKITGHELYRQAMIAGAAVLCENLDAILAGEITGVPQKGVGSYYSTIERRYQIDWNLAAIVIERRVRVHARPYLPAFTYLYNRVVFVNRVRRFDLPGYTTQGGGRILRVEDSGQFVVSCSDGCLMVEDFDVFPTLAPNERGKHFRVGTRLG